MKINVGIFIFLSLIFFLLSNPENTLSQIDQPNLIVCPQNSNDQSCQFFGPDGIQQAVDQSIYGTHILIKKGNYLLNSEVKIINKYIAIIGEGEKNTIISGENLPERNGNMFQIGGSTAVIVNMQIIKGSTAITLYSTNYNDTIGLLSGLNINNNNVGIVITQNPPEHVVIHNNLIHHNSVGIEVAFGENVIIQNNTIDSNQNNIYHGEGSGIWINEPFTGNLTINQNIITNNSHTGGIYSQVSPALVNNSNNLFWNNTQDYQGINQGQNDIFADPQFISTNDYHLKSTSPAKGKGADGQDLGAYGGLGYCDLNPSLCAINITPITASPTATLQPVPIQNGGDANSDGRVNLLDFEILRSQFNNSGSNLSADFNKDGQVNILDFNILRDNFGLSQLQM